MYPSSQKKSAIEGYGVSIPNASSKYAQIDSAHAHSVIAMTSDK